jgi:hypothetical protein
VRKGELVTTSPKSTDGGSVKAAAHRGLFVALLLLTGAAAHAIEVRFDRVAEGVYAHIGDKGPRTVDDEGLNANIGLVVTRDDAVLIDSGAALQSARQIHDAVKTLTPQPVRWVSIPAARITAGWATAISLPRAPKSSPTPAPGPIWSAAATISCKP